MRERFAYNFYNEKKKPKEREYSNILFFGKDLPGLQSFFKCKKYKINHFLLILNLILAEIYFDFSFFYSSDEKQQ